MCLAVGGSQRGADPKVNADAGLGADLDPDLDVDLNVILWLEVKPRTTAQLVLAADEGPLRASGCVQYAALAGRGSFGSTWQGRGLGDCEVERAFAAEAQTRWADGRSREPGVVGSPCSNAHFVVPASAEVAVVVVAGGARHRRGRVLVAQR